LPWVSNETENDLLQRDNRAEASDHDPERPAGLVINQVEKSIQGISSSRNTPSLGVLGAMIYSPHDARNSSIHTRGPGVSHHALESFVAHVVPA